MDAPDAGLGEREEELVLLGGTDRQAAKVPERQQLVGAWGLGG